jgi:hypothetical protein
MADSWNGSVTLDGKRVQSLNSMLDADTGEPTPMKIPANAGICHQGVIPQGKGFVITPDEYLELLEADKSSADVIRPYLDGHDVTDNPNLQPSRYVLDFGEMSEKEARQYKPVFKIAEERIRPERSTGKGTRCVEEWWKHLRPRPEMRRRLSALSEYLVIVGHTKFVTPARVTTDFLPSSALRVFCSDSYALQAFLSSSIHVEWAVKWGSTLGESIRYNPSVVFESIPLPRKTQLLEEIGEQFQKERREIMVRRSLGLTDLYNLMSDPDAKDDVDVVRMRQLQIGVDEAVMSAYGWEDVPLDHGFHVYRRMKRFTVSPTAWSRILDRLVKENLRRANADRAERVDQEALF